MVAIARRTATNSCQSFQPHRLLPDDGATMLPPTADDIPPPRTMRVTWELTLSSILQGVQVVALLCALVYWFVVNAQRGSENERRLTDLQTNVSQQMGDVRQTLAVGLNDMRQQLNSLPDTRARLDQSERRFADLDARHAGFDARITALEHDLIQLRSDIAAITRASNVPLPGGRH
jgi:hypothetical protein